MTYQRQTTATQTMTPQANPGPLCRADGAPVPGAPRTNPGPARDQTLGFA